MKKIFSFYLGRIFISPASSLEYPEFVSVPVHSWSTVSSFVPPFRPTSTNFDQFRPKKNFGPPSGKNFPAMSNARCPISDFKIHSLRWSLHKKEQNGTKRGRGPQTERCVSATYKTQNGTVVPFSFTTLRRSLYRPLCRVRFPKMVLFETNPPWVKMRRLTINNLRREKWYSTISRRRAMTPVQSVAACRSNGKSRLLTVANGCFLLGEWTPTTSHRSPLLPLLPWCRPIRKPIISEHNSSLTAGNSR